MSRKILFAILFVVVVAGFMVIVSCSVDRDSATVVSDEELRSEVDRVAMSGGATEAIDAMVNRLQFSRKVRSLQQEGKVLAEKLGGTNDGEEAAKIAAELKGVYDRMMEDPTYSDTMSRLRAILSPESSDTGSLASTADGTDGSRAISGFSQLKRGDIMLVRSGLITWSMFLYAMWYSHAGNYDGNGLVYESNADGVRLRPLANWQVSGQYIGLARSKKSSAASVASAMDWAKNKYKTDGSTPYNYFYPDKTTDARLYCSQLTWKIHKHLGVDLDSNNWKYLLYVSALWGAVGTAVAIPAVAPDEVSLSGNISIYAKGWN
jgi:cell wall-associated NlpC family hydrolase